jgi:hypothetical protein
MLEATRAVSASGEEAAAAAAEEEAEEETRAWREEEAGAEGEPARPRVGDRAGEGAGAAGAAGAVPASTACSRPWAAAALSARSLAWLRRAAWWPTRRTTSRSSSTESFRPVGRVRPSPPDTGRTALVVVEEEAATPPPRPGREEDDERGAAAGDGDRDCCIDAARGDAGLAARPCAAAAVDALDPAAPGRRAEEEEGTDADTDVDGAVFVEGRGAPPADFGAPTPLAGAADDFMALAAQTGGRDDVGLRRRCGRGWRME